MADKDDVGSVRAEADNKTRNYLKERYDSSLKDFPEQREKNRRQGYGSFNSYKALDVRPDPVPSPLIQIYPEPSSKKGSYTVPKMANGGKVKKSWSK